MSRYSTVVTCGDLGPWASKIVLELPCDVLGASVDAGCFNVFAWSVDMRSGEVRERHGAPLEGYLSCSTAYTCDERGNRAASGSHIALELCEQPLTMRIEGSLVGSWQVDPRFRVTQLAPLIATDGRAVSGLVFDERAAEIAPELEGWSFGEGVFAGERMAYGVFTPDFEAIHAAERIPNILGHLPEPIGDKIPLVVWLHGGGEGGFDPWVTVCGNKVTALSGAHIQECLGRAAYVLVPTSPTFWMDDGEVQLGTSNQSKWADAVFEMIGRFIEEHGETIDRSRLYLGGLSNGGFLTLRLLADHPGFFACGVAVCAPFYECSRKPGEAEAMAQTPLWLVHCKQDKVVIPQETVLPLHAALVDAGAADLHLTYYDENRSSHYRDADGRARWFPGHLVWIQTYDDDPRTDLDGGHAIADGVPVTLWEWVGRHSLR